MGLRFDNMISMGHLLTFSVMLISGMGAFFHVKNQADNTHAIVVALKADLVILQNQTHALSLTQAAYSAEVRSITNGIQRLEVQLERIIGGTPAKN